MKTRMLILSILLIAVLITFLGSCVTTATTRLKSAVWSGDYYEVKSLIESGADVNVRDSRD
jgi:hypothetical protein